MKNRTELAPKLAERIENEPAKASNALLRLIAQLDKLMHERRLSPRALSIQAGLAPDGVRNILRGKSASPRHRTLKAIADVLQVSVPQLMGDEERTADQLIDVLLDEPVAPGMMLIKEVDSRGHGGQPVAKGQWKIRHSWIMPAELFAGRLIEESELVVLSAPHDLPPDYRAGDKLLVDLAWRAPSPDGAYLIYDGYIYRLVYIAMDEGPSTARAERTVRVVDARGGEGRSVRAADLDIAGRAVARWCWL
ncbi:MAG: helix-turn-helix domain-containing protein [Janthinobacterium lividum]